MCMFFKDMTTSEAFLSLSFTFRIEYELISFSFGESVCGEKLAVGLENWAF